MEKAKKEFIKKIAKEVQNEIKAGKATFFITKEGENSDIEDISAEELLYELKADISDRVALYFHKLLL